MDYMEFMPIAHNGGGLDIDLNKNRLNVNAIEMIAHEGAATKSPLILRNATFTQSEMVAIARKSPGNVIFVV